MDLEHAVICTVIASQNYAEVMEHGVKPEYFTDTTHRRVFELIGEHLLDHRKVPGKEAVHRAFPNYSFDSYTDYPEPVGYYARQLRGRHIQSTLMAGLVSDIQPMLNDPTVDGFDLQEALGKLLFDSSTDMVSGLSMDAAQYISGYLEIELALREKLGYLRGVGTGFDSLDRATGGYQAQQLVTFVGLPKHGKSTMMLAAALAAKRQGYRVLFVTFEMSVDEQMDRLASLLSSLSLTKIMDGELTHNQKEHLFAALKKWQSMVGMRFVHDRNSMMTLSSVNQTVLDNKPDIVFIDGMYMMEDERGERAMSPQAITNLTRGMKRLAQSHKIPFVVSTQALISRSRGGLRVDSIGYSSSFLQDSDIVIGVEKKTPTLSEFKAMAVRAGKNLTAYIRIDWDHGLIEEIDPAVAQAEIDNKPGPSTGGKKGWS